MKYLFFACLVLTQPYMTPSFHTIWLFQDLGFGHVLTRPGFTWRGSDVFVNVRDDEKERTVRATGVLVPTSSAVVVWLT